jgi:hypothetical protein
VVADALTTLALARAGLVGAGASCHVFLYLALHIVPPQG